MKVCLVGYGKLGSSLAKGLRNAGAEVKVSTLPPTDEWARSDGFEVVGLKECEDFGDVVIVAVPPSAVEAVVSELRGRKPVISTAALVKLDRLKRHVEDAYRIMPSVTVEVNSSPVLIAEKGGRYDGLVEELVRMVGTPHWVDERTLDAALPVVGSGPAVHALYLQSLIEAMVYSGVDRGLAEELARESLEGALRMAEKYDPYQLRSKVETPGGITVEMSTELEAKGVFGKMAEVLGRKGRELTR
ncbi:MAG: NAD(P)-binding domain-containing protein [Crenarchaeota archaeon]|nr:NAD(P)-binding domain-containing protein [Thermoproteota archaeon]